MGKSLTLVTLGEIVCLLRRTSPAEAAPNKAAQKEQLEPTFINLHREMKQSDLSMVPVLGLAAGLLGVSVGKPTIASIQKGPYDLSGEFMRNVAQVFEELVHSGKQLGSRWAWLAWQQATASA